VEDLLASLNIDAPQCIGPTYTVTVNWDSGSRFLRILRWLIGWLIWILKHLFSLRTWQTTGNYSVTCTGPGILTNTQPAPPYPGPTGSVQFTFTGATSGGAITAALFQQANPNALAGNQVTVGWCPGYYSSPAPPIPDARLPGCQKLNITVPDGMHAGVYSAMVASPHSWRVQIGGLTCEVASDWYGAGAVMRVGSASAAPLETAFEPFSATFPGHLLGARGNILVTEA
jgi:hypothetical protein